MHRVLLFGRSINHFIASFHTFFMIGIAFFPLLIIVLSFFSLLLLFGRKCFLMFYSFPFDSLYSMDYIGLGCCALAFVLYFNTLDAGFVYDDR